MPTNELTGIQWMRDWNGKTTRRQARSTGITEKKRNKNEKKEEKKLEITQIKDAIENLA